MGETIIINVDFRTPTERLNLLHTRLADWVNSNSRDFAPGFDMRVTDIIDVNQIILSLWLPHKGNWQDLGKRFQRRTKVKEEKHGKHWSVGAITLLYVYVTFYSSNSYSPFSLSSL